MILGEDFWRPKASSSSTTKSNDKIIFDGNDKSTECNVYLLMVIFKFLLFIIYFIIYRSVN